MKMSRFYEKLFCYLGNFKHQETGFNLVNEKEDIFVELKTNFLSDNAEHNKFHHFKKYKTNNPDAKIYYICLNDKRKKCRIYTSLWLPKIITGKKLGSFCKCADINVNELINFLRALVRERI